MNNDFIKKYQDNKNGFLDCVDYLQSELSHKASLEVASAMYNLITKSMEAEEQL